MRFLHLKVLGESVESLKEQVVQAGLDPSYLDKEFPDYRKIPKYRHYLDERRRGVSKDVLKQRMIAENLDEHVLDVYDIEDIHMRRVDYLQYIEYFRRKENGERIDDLQLEMEKAGLDSSVLVYDVDSIEFYNIPYDVVIHGDSSAILSPAAIASPPSTATTTCQHKYVKMVDYAYSKKFKAVQMGQPKEQVQMRMGIEGMDPSVLDLDMNTVGFLNIPEGEVVKYPDGHIEPCCTPGASVAPATCQHKYVKMVDYAYSKKFKAVQMGQPKEQVQMRMGIEGMDPSILDLDMNTVGFLNIPEGEVVKYPDGHIEPCCTPDTPVAPSSSTPLSVAPSSSSIRSTAPKKETKPKDEIIPPRPKFKHNAKLRPLYWDILSSKAVVEKSMWFNMNDRDIKLDTAMLDLEFSTKQITFVLPTEPVAASEKVVNLFDPKREQNVGIAIGRLKIPIRDIHHALLFGDFDILTRELIGQLVNAAPTPEEQEVCLGFQGDEKKLSSASRFAYELSDIPNVLQRLQCCKTILLFDDETERIKKVIEVYETNEKMMMNSAGIRKLMEIILAVGNYLNGDSIRGGAWGFNISLLPKLSQTKSSDGTKTLLT